MHPVLMGFAGIAALALIVSWVESYRGIPKTGRVKWTPPEGIYLLHQHGEGVRKPLKTTQVHQVETPFTKVFIPAGFEYNGASIPMYAKPLILLFDPWERYEPPAAVHDLLYSLRLDSRFSADAFFYELMKDRGVPIIARLLIYYAVRLFGWMHWKDVDAAEMHYQRSQQTLAAAHFEPEALEGLA